MGSNPVEASEFSLGFICNCLSYITTTKISFTSNVNCDRDRVTSQTLPLFLVLGSVEKCPGLYCGRQISGNGIALDCGVSVIFLIIYKLNFQ